MKNPSLFVVTIVAALSGMSYAADEAAPAKCCMAPRKETPPAMGCCCMSMNTKMQGGKETAEKAPDLNALVEQMKTAKSDQLLDAMAAVIKKLIEERQAGEAKGVDGPGPGHQH